MKINILSYPGLEPEEQLLEEISKIHQQPKENIVFSIDNIESSCVVSIFVCLILNCKSR